MRSRPNPAEALVALSRVRDVSERRANWRQAIAALSQTSPALGPPPLDCVDTKGLEEAVTGALQTGLADDLDWIDPASAALALYEILAALHSQELRRELGRRVLARINAGTLSTFATVAARMALGSGRTLESPPMQARMALLFDLPIGSTVRVDPLAFTIVSRPELFAHWVERRSTGALPARRMAARLFEHAAREASHRAQVGAPVHDLLTSAWARPAFHRLLADREPLVWRHAAVARGLFSSINSELRDEIELGLDPGLSPTEWRRAAVSLVAGMAAKPDEGFAECLRLTGSELAERDPGLLACMVLGLPRVIEAEPDIAEAFLAQLGESKRADVAEAVADLLKDVSLPQFGNSVRKSLGDSLADNGTKNLLSQVAEHALVNLSRRGKGEASLGEAIRQSMTALEVDGARQAFELAEAALEQAHKCLDRLTAGNLQDPQQLPELMATLGDLDLNVLEHARLSNLLLLKRRPGETNPSVPGLDRFYNRLSHYLLESEQKFQSSRQESIGLVQANKRCLKALLHLVDLETATSDSDESGVRTRLRQAIGILIQRLAYRGSGGAHRIVCATLARSFDAAVREDVYDASEVILAVLHSLSDGPTVSAIAEGSTRPDVREPLKAYARFLNPSEETIPPPALDSEAPAPINTEPTRLAASVLLLGQSLSAGGGFRGEALKQTVLRLGRALRAVADARGAEQLVDTSGSGTHVIGEVEAATESLRSMMKFVEKRLLGRELDGLEVVAEVTPLSTLIERAVVSGVPANRRQIEMALAELTADLPAPLAHATQKVLLRIPTIPIQCPSDVYAIPLEKRRAPLPDWLLPRRTIGAFYIVRALGSGGVSSVFLARRFEERHNRKAEAFAVKVPQYDPTTARSLSEHEFLQMFRDEAGALLSLPEHPNLARFVTFDLAARPKPILVMELIHGAGLDRLVRTRSLTIRDVFSHLDGILAALDAMHAVGVGHLDVKPSNVILRDGRTPVLVDFGLSGRHLRPGCGTLEYCAPEILGAGPQDYRSTGPLPADVYAFACTAYELLTGALLFTAEDEMRLMALQVGHDGWPKGLTRMAHTPGLRDLAVILAACLRRDPRERPAVRQVRAALRDVAPTVTEMPWPVVVRRSTPALASA